MPSPTIRDVARLANVSTATVSRVLNHEPGVRYATIEKVKKAINDCQYVPNSVARNLKMDMTKTVGFVVSDISNSHFTIMAKVIESVLRKNGYSTFLCGTDDSSSQELDYLKQMECARVDGLILNTTNLNNDYVVELSQRIPIVLVDRSIKHGGFCGDFVGSNNQAGIETLVNYLIDNGHRKIGFICSHQDISTSRERRAGFFMAMKNVGIQVDNSYPYYFFSENMSIDSGVSGCRHLMSLADPPTAIVIANNAMTVGALKYLHTNNVEIPKEFSIVSYGNVDNSELFSASLGYVTLNPYFIGEKAANYLLSRIKEPQIRNRETIFEPSFVKNGSIKRL